MVYQIDGLYLIRRKKFYVLYISNICLNGKELDKIKHPSDAQTVMSFLSFGEANQRKNVKKLSSDSLNEILISRSFIWFECEFECCISYCKHSMLIFKKRQMLSIRIKQSQRSRWHRIAEFDASRRRNHKQKPWLVYETWLCFIHAATAQSNLGICFVDFVGNVYALQTDDCIVKLNQWR